MTACPGLRAEQYNLGELLSHCDPSLTPLEKQSTLAAASRWTRAVISVREELLHPLCREMAPAEVERAQIIFTDVSAELETLAHASAGMAIFDRGVERITARLIALFQREASPGGLWTLVGGFVGNDGLDQRITRRFRELVRHH